MPGLWPPRRAPCLQCRLRLVLGPSCSTRSLVRPRLRPPTAPAAQNIRHSSTSSSSPPSDDSVPPSDDSLPPEVDYSTLAALLSEHAPQREGSWTPRARRKRTYRTRGGQVMREDSESLGINILGRPGEAIVLRVEAPGQGAAVKSQSGEGGEEAGLEGEEDDGKSATSRVDGDAADSRTGPTRRDIVRSLEAEASEAAPSWESVRRHVDSLRPGWVYGAGEWTDRRQDAAEAGLRAMSAAAYDRLHRALAAGFTNRQLAQYMAHHAAASKARYRGGVADDDDGDDAQQSKKKKRPHAHAGGFQPWKAPPALQRARGGVPVPRGASTATHLLRECWGLSPGPTHAVGEVRMTLRPLRLRDPRRPSASLSSTEQPPPARKAKAKKQKNQPEAAAVVLVANPFLKARFRPRLLGPLGAALRLAPGEGVQVMADARRPGPAGTLVVTAARHRAEGAAARVGRVLQGVRAAEVPLAGGALQLLVQQQQQQQQQQASHKAPAPAPTVAALSRDVLAHLGGLTDTLLAVRETKDGGAFLDVQWFDEEAIARAQDAAGDKENDDGGGGAYNTSPADAVTRLLAVSRRPTHDALQALVTPARRKPASTWPWPEPRLLLISDPSPAAAAAAAQSQQRDHFPSGRPAAVVAATALPLLPWWDRAARWARLVAPTPLTAHRTEAKSSAADDDDDAAAGGVPAKAHVVRALDRWRRYTAAHLQSTLPPPPPEEGKASSPSPAPAPAPALTAYTTTLCATFGRVLHQPSRATVGKTPAAAAAAATATAPPLAPLLTAAPGSLLQGSGARHHRRILQPALPSARSLVETVVAAAAAAGDAVEGEEEEDVLPTSRGTTATTTPPSPTVTLRFLPVPPVQPTHSPAPSEPASAGDQILQSYAPPLEVTLVLDPATGEVVLPLPSTSTHHHQEDLSPTTAAALRLRAVPFGPARNLLLDVVCPGAEVDVRIYGTVTGDEHGETPFQLLGEEEEDEGGAKQDKKTKQKHKGSSHDDDGAAVLQRFLRGFAVDLGRSTLPAALGWPSTASAFSPSASFPPSTLGAGLLRYSVASPSLGVVAFPRQRLASLRREYDDEPVVEEAGEEASVQGDEREEKKNKKKKRHGQQKHQLQQRVAVRYALGSVTLRRELLPADARVGVGGDGENKRFFGVKLTQVAECEGELYEDGVTAGGSGNFRTELARCRTELTLEGPAQIIGGGGGLDAEATEKTATELADAAFVDAVYELVNGGKLRWGRGWSWRRRAVEKDEGTEDEVD